MDDAEIVKSKVDIVEVISSYIPLKKAGRNFSGLCPFHNEKTPSFMVSAERQAFKCFGCGEGGDVFTFLEKQEGWEFREVLEELAKRSGVALKAFKNTKTSNLKERLLEINKLASNFYKYILFEHKSGKAAREYLEKRGLNKKIWEEFDLGYAPRGWENLSNFLVKRSKSMADIATSGLVVGRSGKSASYYDRFRDRIIFPIKDSRGKILGFSGRLISDNAREARPPATESMGYVGQAKYINSPQTPIFNKGTLLFGLDIAKSEIREKNEVILVEGEFDVLSSHKAGVVNVVASKGTALTEFQVTSISRQCENVVLCFDTDLAGDAAARRGIELLDIAGLNIQVANLDKYKDPDEFAQKNAVGFRKAIKNAENIYDYLIDSASKRFDASSVDGKKKIGRELIPTIAKISDDVVRAHYIGKLARILDLESELISEAVSKKIDNKYIDGESLPLSESDENKDVLTREDYFLALLFFGEDILLEIVEMLDSSDFTKKEAKRLWSGVRDIIKNSKVRSTSKLLKKLPRSISGYVDELYLININPEFGEKELWANEIIKTAKILKISSLKKKLDEISVNLKEAQKDSDEKRIEVLFAKFNKVSEDIKRIGI